MVIDPTADVLKAALRHTVHLYQVNYLGYVFVRSEISIGVLGGGNWTGLAQNVMIAFIDETPRRMDLKTERVITKLFS